jgi:hypothetical protein
MSAGPWFSGSGWGDANQTLATRLIQRKISAADNNRFVLADPVMRGILGRDASLGALVGALGISIGLAEIGSGVAAAVSEGSASTPTNFAVDMVNLSPSRRAFSRKASDFGLSFTESLIDGSLGASHVGVIIEDGMGVYGNTLVRDVCALATSATYTAGSSGGRLTWAALSQALIEAKARGGVGGGGICGVITGKGLLDLTNDAISMGGAAALSGQLQQFMAQGPAMGGFVGEFFGGQLRLYLSDRVAVDGSDTVAPLFSEAGIATKHQPVALGVGAIAVANAGFWTMEAIRGAGGVTTFEIAFHLATGILDPKGLTAITYATT